MWLAFIIALALEMLGEAKTIGRAVGYILLATLLSMILTPILAFFTTAEAYTVAWNTYLLVSIAYAIIGLIVAKILRAVAARR